MSLPLGDAHGPRGHDGRRQPHDDRSRPRLMPIETVKCQECGSADVTELKTGSYVCQHCESVFKWTRAVGTGTDEKYCECGRISDAI